MQGDTRPTAEATEMDAGRASPAFLMGPVNIRSAALTGIFVILAFTAIALARTLLIPLVLAVIAQFALTPAVRVLERARIPSSVGAALVLAVVLAFGASAVSFGYEPAGEWITKLPESLNQLEHRLRPVREPIADAMEATEEVARIAEPASAAAPVTIQEGNLLGRLLTQTGNVVVTAAVVLVLLYFLLASGDAFLRKLVTVLPRFSDKRRAAELVRRIEGDISRYLVSVALINAGLGLAVAMALTAVGMPEAGFWGALAAVLNFIPFLGAVTLACVLTLAAAAELGSLGHVALVVGAGVFLTSLEGLLVTPTVLGSRMTLSPFAVLVSVLLWSWLWGIPGAFVAVPMLVILKAIFDAFPSLRVVGVMLERDVSEHGTRVAQQETTA